MPIFLRFNNYIKFSYKIYKLFVKYAKQLGLTHDAPSLGFLQFQLFS